MKAKDFLDFILRTQIDCESLAKVPIDETNEFESQKDFFETFFGISTDKEIPAGEYLYIYDDVFSDWVYEDKFFKLADLVLETFEESKRNYKIYLFRIED